MGATDMLVCGEDLGMIPTCVHPVMAELGFVGGWGLLVQHTLAGVCCMPCRAHVVFEQAICVAAAA